MDFLTKTFAQIVDLFRSMTPGSRVVSGLLLAMVVVSLIYLVGHQATSADAFLMEGEPFSASQLPAMEAAFAKGNLNTYEIEGNRIRVPRAQQSAYMGALADAKALPSHFGSYLAQVTEDSNPFERKDQQEERKKVALEQELAQIVSSMHGIENASVLYDSEVQGGLKEEKVVTATVSVKPLGNEQLDEERVPMIRAVLGGAIAGLDPDNVTVADLNSDRVFPAGKKGQPGIGQDPYAATKLRYEKEWESKIRDALSFIPGVNVKVNVELNPELEIKEDQTNVEAKTVPIEETEERRTFDAAPPTSVNRPGSVAAQPAANVPVSLNATEDPQSNDEIIRRQVKSLPSTKSSSIKRAPLTPRRVAVTVGVLSNYYENIWHERNPSPAGADPRTPDPIALAQIEATEKKKIHDYVSQLIPLPAAGVPAAGPTAAGVPDGAPLVSVMTFQHLPTLAIAPPKLTDQALVWVGQYGATAGMVLVGLVSLLMFRGIVRTAARTASTVESPRRPLPAARAAAAEDTTKFADEADDAPSPLKRRAKSDRSLRDELANIVRDDPDAAANVLRSWIGTTN